MEFKKKRTSSLYPQVHFLDKGKSSHIVCQKELQEWSLSKILKFLSSEPSCARIPQYKSPSVPLSSMFLLAWPIQQHLKCFNVFLTQSPKVQIPTKKKKKNHGQAYYSIALVFDINYYFS